VCGNLVIDATEDCDGFSAFGGGTRCAGPGEDNACFYVCGDGVVGSEPGDGPLRGGCPPGWGCGQDGRCRRPSGMFTAAGPSWHMPVQSFAIGDVDGDGHADLIGNNQQTLMVRYGSPSADFQDSFEMNIRRPVGEVTYARLDEDHRLDAIIPTQEGLFVLLGSEGRTLEPVAYSSFNFEDDDVRFYAADVAATPLTEVLFFDKNPDGVVGGFVFSSAPPAQLAEPPGGVSVQPIEPVTGDVTGDGREEVIVAYPGGAAIHVYSIAGGPGEAGAESTFHLGAHVSLALPGPARVGQRMHMADVDGDGKLDLLIGLEGGQVAVAYGAGGQLEAPVIEPVFGTPTSLRPFPLAAGDLDGDGMADYVYPDRIVLARQTDGDREPDLLVPVAFATLGPWSDAVIGDFNADGRPDVAVAVDGDGAGAGATGIDILVQSEVGLFNRFPIDTRRPPRTSPRTLVVGDFDGDLVDDLGFAEDGREVAPDAVAVVFGARHGGFSAPVKMGELDVIMQLVPARMANAPSNFDGIFDLLVLSRTGPGTALAVLLGDSSRRMVSPFMLAEGPEAGPGNVHVPVRALVGDFDRDGIRDLLAVAVAFGAGSGDGDPGLSGRAQPSAWFLPGQGGGRIDTGRVGFTALDSYAGFNFLCSTWESMSLGPMGAGPSTGASEIVGVDDGGVCGGYAGESLAAPELLVVDVTLGAGGQPAFEPHHAQIDAALSSPGSVSAADLDGDGDLDPIVLFRGQHRTSSGEDGPIPGAGVAILWNDDGVPRSSQISIIEPPDTSTLGGVAAIFLDEDDHRDLVIITDYLIYQVLYDPELGTFRPAEPLFVDLGIQIFGEGGLLGVGDMNGDGLEDIAVVRGSTVTVLLAVPAAPLGAGFDDLARPQPAGGQR
jgi:hypothetical protein